MPRTDPRAGRPAPRLGTSVCTLLVLLILSSNGAACPSCPAEEVLPPRQGAPAQPPVSEAQKRARELIAQLNDDRYDVRQQAYELLKCLGRPALEPLQEALSSPHAEVRARAMELLIYLRGRGFVGISLREAPETTQQLADPPPVPQAEEDDMPPAPQPLRPPAAQHVIPSLLLAEDILSNMPAEKAGFERGDKILAINGRAVQGILDFMREVSLAGPGQTCAVLVERAGERFTIGVTPTRNPYDFAPLDLRTASDRDREMREPLDPRIGPLPGVPFPIPPPAPEK